MSSKMYEKAGVSIAAGEALVDKIKKINPAIGGFAGLYKLDEERSLVACTDGVGTKLKLGIQMKRYEDLGQDLVAMSVNDLIVCGARPLFFLDYFATGKLDVDVAHRVIQGIVRACEQSGCLLLGGETAEMPGFYEDKQFDIAGFAVGEVWNHEIIDGQKTKAGDIIVALPSHGFQSNGYSLIHKIITEQKIQLTDTFQDETWGDLLTRPTRLFVKDILRIKKEINIKAMAHITGGGLTNIQRVLAKGLSYSIDKKKIPTPAFMRHLQIIGQISDEEAFTVWNMGIGFILIVSPETLPTLKELQADCFIVGEIVQNS